MGNRRSPSRRFDSMTWLCCKHLNIRAAYWLTSVGDMLVRYGGERIPLREEAGSFALAER